MTTRLVMPKLGLSMTEGTILSWNKNEGDRVARGEIIYVLETDKVTYEVEAPASGILARIIAGAGAVVPVGEVVAYLSEVGEQLDGAPQEAVEVARAGASTEGGVAAAEARISPLARRMAKEHGLDLSSLRGTRPDGRVVKEDVLRAIEEQKATVVSPAMHNFAAADNVASLHGVTKPLSSMRKTIARRMTESFQTPHFYLSVEVDASELGHCRELLLPMVESKAGVKLTETDLLIKMVGCAIEQNPSINCSHVDDAVRLLDDINIGLVVSVEGGLLVPVIRQANKKSLAEIAAARSSLVQKARERRLEQEEMSGSTFTISNLGMFGIDRFSAIIQPPEAAILAVGRIADRAVVRDRQILVRPVMDLTLSVDHRVLDGVSGASFLRSLKTLIEYPAAIIAY